MAEILRLRSEWGPLQAPAFEQERALLYAVAVRIHDGEDAGAAGRAGAPEGDAGVGAIFANDVVLHIEEADFGHVAVVVTHDAAEGFQSGFLRSVPLAHELDDGVSAGDLDVFFA